MIKVGVGNGFSTSFKHRRIEYFPRKLTSCPEKWKQVVQPFHL